MSSTTIKAPQKEEFDVSIKYYAFYFASCIIGGVCSLYAPISESELITNSFTFPGWLSPFFSALSLLTIISLFVSERLYKCSKEKAEAERRNGLLDDIYGTKFASSESVAYYDNDEINDHSKKLLANIHENCFHTAVITKKMLFRQTVFLAPVLPLLLFFAWKGFGNSPASFAILELFLSYTLAFRWLDLYDLHKESKRIDKDARNLWSCESPPIAEIINLVIAYEVAVTSANILLNQKIYFAHKDTLLKKWIDLKARYSIK